jgi:xanthine dehydrogenase accessory factor
MERRETEDILASIKDARGQNQGIALATVVRVKGSAYRREGAKMLVRDDGAMTCMLSGGCLEPEVVEVAKRVIADGQPLVTAYDLEEDVVWGLGIGCGGSVDIRIERLEQDAVMEAWLGVLERAEVGVLATVLEDKSGSASSPVGAVLRARSASSPSGAVLRARSASGRMMITESETRGSLEPSNLERKVLEAAHEMMGALYPRSETRTFKLEDGSRADVFLDASAPPPELVIFGAGHDAMPLNSRARDLGWRVTVVDVREAFMTLGRFPDAKLQVAHFEEFHRLEIGPRSFIVIMNHHLERDRESLRFALESSAPYIGVLGPRERFHKLIDALADEGFKPSAAQLEKVRSPVGLGIGAESPDEVALSIMAELIAVRRGFGGGFLSGLEGRIHDPGAN